MPERAAADAPGRVNLIGEHTDYHEGYVLPTVIPQRTRVDVQRRSDRAVRALSTAVCTEYVTFELGAESPGRGWLDYVQGVTSMLTQQGIVIPGFDVRIQSDVPVGAGV